MKISVDQSEILETYPYLEVGSKISADSSIPETLQKSLPIYLGEYVNESTDLDLLIITSDLQGIAEDGGEQFLLGEKLPSFLKTLIEIELPECKKIGVFLCGDLYTSLEKRGASGDVRSIWRAFDKYFDWVVGVAGNHDTFGMVEEEQAFKAGDNIHLLHKELISVDELSIGGISGIIGRVDKANRVDEKDFLESLVKLSRQKPDFILLHETPDFPPLNLIGNSQIRNQIEKISRTNICCGHCFWNNSLVTLGDETQVLNVDSKVVLLKVKKTERS